MFVQLTARNRHFVTVGLPILALLGSFAIAYPRYAALHADEAELASVRAQIAAQQTTLTQLRAEPVSTFIIRVPASPDEPVGFLRNLNGVARSCGVSIAAYTTAPVGPASDSGAAKVPGPDDLPAGTTAVTLDITAEGNYVAMARFFERLETYPRLINVSQVSIQAKKYPLLAAKFHLSRYTGAAAPPVAAR